jgi:hypothetical protein
VHVVINVGVGIGTSIALVSDVTLAFGITLDSIVNTSMGLRC